MGAVAVLDAILGAFFGAAAGSFLGCAAYRLPRRVSMNGRSHCPSCGTQLRWYWNIPVLSWLALRGRTACCATCLSASYLAYEVACCIIGALAGLLLGLYVVLGAVIVVMVCVGVAGAVRSR
jgi:leader peptidase (prepilin peptidase) / N-methyltransferase